MLKGINFEIKQATNNCSGGCIGKWEKYTFVHYGRIKCAEQKESIVENEDIYLMSDDELTSWRGKNIGYLFQNIQMSSALTVRENLMFAREFGNDKSIDVEMMLDRFGLKEVAESLPGRLSGGQKRRAMIASVLVRKPKIILADEPTNDLDHIWAEQIIEYLEKEVQPEGALVLVTHDLKWAERAKIKYKMEEGRIYR